MLITSAEVFQNVMMQVIEVLTARQRFAITEENRDEAQRILDLIARLVDSGSIPGAQSARARAALGRAANQVEDAKRQLVEARAALADAISLEATQLPRCPMTCRCPISTPPPRSPTWWSTRSVRREPTPG